MKILFTAAAFISVFLISCESIDVQCQNRTLDIYFKGYPLADIDTFIIRKYTANNNFSQQLDSIKVIHGHSANYAFQNDTTIVFYYYGNTITAGFDWQIFIPAKNKTVSITDIKSPQESLKCRQSLFNRNKDLCGCFNPVYSYKKDNQLIMFSNPYEFILYFQ